jgi:hypothetical protein
MASHDRNRRLWAVGFFVMTLVAVKLAATMFGGGAPGPAQASPDVSTAGGDPAPGTAPPVAKVEWTERQRAAGEYVRQLAQQSFGPTPLLYTAKPRPGQTSPTIEPILQSPRPQFVLRAVMATSSGNKALIDGRMYQIGEKVRGSGWVVQTIDIDARSVTLVDIDGSTIHLTVQTPG